MEANTINEQLTPMLKQFLDLKKKHPDAILLFRCGDFYETYQKDAEKASKILGITLTKSTKQNDTDGKPLAMAGFPYHALDTYLPKIIRAGERVAICDQIEAPKNTVKRGVTEMIEKNNNNLKAEKEMTNEEINKQIEQVKIDAEAKVLRIASETIKSLGGKLPVTLNTYLSDALGKIVLIKLKNSHNADITKDEMNYLIEWAEKGLNTNK